MYIYIYIYIYIHIYIYQSESILVFKVIQSEIHLHMLEFGEVSLPHLPLFDGVTSSWKPETSST